MADVFNQNPDSFVNMNDLFPVLNDKVGLTSNQWKKAIENAFYLYNNLGLANVLVGNVSTIFTSPGTMSDVTVTHREETLNGKVYDYFDYTFYIPSPKIETSMVQEKVEKIDDVGIFLSQSNIYGTNNLADTIIGYRFDFTNKFIPTITIDNKLSFTSTNPVENKVITASLENLRLSLTPQMETITIATFEKAEDIEPYTHIGTATLTTPITENSTIELINNNAILFGTYGFAIGSVDWQNLTIYSIEAPTKSVDLLLSVEVKND